MSDCDNLIIHLMKHYRGKLLYLHKQLKRRDLDHVDIDYILGLFKAYKTVLDDLDSLL